MRWDIQKIMERNGFAADAQAIKGDFASVGGDIQTAIRKFTKETGGKLPRKKGRE